MWRIVWSCLCLTLAGCTGLDNSGGTFAAGRPLPGVTADSTVMRRLIGQDALDRPLLPQPGDIWADVLPAAQRSPGGAPSVSPGHVVRSVAPMASSGVQPRAVSQLIVAIAPAAAVPAAVPEMQAAPRDAVRPLVQLAAAPSRQGAEAAWRRLRQQAPTLTDGRLPVVSEAEVNGQHVWRLRAFGFADVAEAGAFCAGIRAVAAGCWVVRATASP
jgi:hypothetical protein